MYLLVFAFVTMVTMSCDAIPAAVSRKYENVAAATTTSKDINLPEDILISSFEADSHYTHTSTENLGMNHEVDKKTLAEANAVSSRVEKHGTRAPGSATAGNLKTRDGTTFSSLSLIYVPEMVEGDGRIDLGVKYEEKDNIVKILSGSNSIVMPTLTKNISSKKLANFENSLPPVHSQELFSAQGSTKNLSIKLSIESTEKPVISIETSGDIQLLQTNTHDVEIKSNRGYKIFDSSEQYLNRSQSAISSKTDNTDNGTIYNRQSNKHGLNLALRREQAQDNSTSCNKTAVKDCNPERGLIARLSETVNLNDSGIRSAMLQHAFRTHQPTLQFPHVPEGGKFHIQELDLSEGLRIFTYISSFLSWIQPYEFPVGKFTVQC
jgi:hypothetical protein